jgi:hypothetical protein
MASLIKAFVVGLLIILNVILIICTMEIVNDVTEFQAICLGLACCITTTGCIGAAVGISMVNTES